MKEDPVKSKILDLAFISGSLNISELKSAGFNLDYWNWLYGIGFRYNGSGSFHIPDFSHF